MDEPDFDAVQRQTEAIVGAIYEASADEAGNVSIDINTTIFALALASFQIVNLMAGTAQPEAESQPEAEPIPAGQRRRGYIIGDRS